MVNRRAFSLAEVLITLVVIGIIVSITVNNIFVSTFKREVLSKLKKNYASFAHAILLSKFENGSINNWYDMAEKNAYNYYNLFLRKYLQTGNICTDYKDCGYKNSKPWKYLNGDVYNWTIMEEKETRVFFYLNDGTFVAVKTGSLSCSKKDSNGICIGEQNAASLEAPVVIIDINGGKEPNMFGKDVFLLYLDNDTGVVPHGKTYTKSLINSNCSLSDKGTCCLMRIIGNSWQFDKDYPI